MTIMNAEGIAYEAGPLIGSTEKFKLYHCPHSGYNACILKIATLPEYNGILDREADLLNTLRVEAAKAQAEFSAHAENSNIYLNYQLLFPILLDSFINPNQGKRRINIIDLSKVSDELKQLVPLSHIISREKLRVDPRTSAWILGKLLKLLVFTQSLGINIGNLSRDNILINREQHYVTVFDWSMAKLGDSALEATETAIEIGQVAREITLLLGGDPINGLLPPSNQLTDSRYEDYLRHLACYEERDASAAHRKFYELIRELWPSDFYPYTAIKLT